jgi:hypothetical protein
MGVGIALPRTFSGDDDFSTTIKWMQGVFGNFNLKILIEQIFFKIGVVERFLRRGIDPFDG